MNRNSFGIRYLSEHDFNGYAQSLKLPWFANSGNLALLEFFEQEGILKPVARLVWPDAYSLHNNQDSLSDNRRASQRSELSPEDARDIEMFHDALSHSTVWHDTLQPHPLDIEQAPYRRFVENPLQPFRPWRSYRVNLRAEDEDPLYASDNTLTYYHYWQIFVLADALDMGVKILFDQNDPALRDLMPEDIPAGRTRAYESFAGAKGIRSADTHRNAFEAVSYFCAERNRAFSIVAVNDKAEFPNKRIGMRLGETAAALWHDYDKSILAATIDRYRPSKEELLTFIRWQCERWQDADHCGAPRLKDEWKKNIGQSALLLRRVEGLSFSDVSDLVGRATGHFKSTLEVLFPKPFEDAKEAVRRSLIGMVKGSGILSLRGTGVSEKDVPSFLSWIEESGITALFLQWESITGNFRDFSETGVATTRREVQALAATFELALGAMVDTRISGHTLAKRLKGVWADWRPHLEQYAKLKTFSLNDDLREKLAAIDSISPASKKRKRILALLLKASLIRNCFTHHGVTAFDKLNHPDVVDAALILLAAMFLSYKRAAKAGMA